MPRIARIVVPHVPHHVTQRGNRRQATFFREDDFEHYKRLLARWCEHYGVEVWCYCLMPNHVHLILLPSDTSGLARAVGETHRRYTLAVNQREGWSGYLWQGRFASFPMSERYLLNAVRYVLLNPVRSGLTTNARAWRHSSVHAHRSGRSDGVVDPRPLATRVAHWATMLRPELADDDAELMRSRLRTGRPLGDRAFVQELEEATGRRLKKRLPGRPRAKQAATRERGRGPKK